MWQEMEKLRPNKTLTAKELSEKAIDWLAKNELPPTPINYAVLYAYFHPDYPDLRNELSQWQEKNRKFDSFLLSDLYKSHLDENQNNQPESIFILNQLISNLQTECEKSESSVLDYQSTLTAQSQKLNALSDETQTKKIVDTIIDATKTVKTKQSEFIDTIHSSHDQVAQLKKQLQQAEQQALTDPLTGLANRRGLRKFLSDQSSDSSYSIVIFDIDHFKRLNDSYGHSVGDIVLSKVAKLISKDLSNSQLAVRYGGEEFLVIFPDVSKKQLFIYAETVRENIEEMKLIYGKTQQRMPPITLSGGIAMADKNKDEAINDIIDKADKALYEAKSSGRNRICLNS
ncbi:GGDEF domain-containing protein [Catenovulum sediminis]|uniref:diguanylate cyclase n=1 Tax=Catenovulum sediminis TaxID=1740262 RepID=A0ABV1RMW9_9ALTE